MPSAVWNISYHFPVICVYSTVKCCNMWWSSEGCFLGFVEKIWKLVHVCWKMNENRDLYFFPIQIFSSSGTSLITFPLGFSVHNFLLLKVSLELNIHSPTECDSKQGIIIVYHKIIVNNIFIRTSDYVWEVKASQSQGSIFISFSFFHWTFCQNCLCHYALLF